MYISSASIIFLDHSLSSVFLQYEKEFQCYSHFGGKKENNEDAYNIMLRELKEELGIIPKFEIIDMKYFKKSKMVVYYAIMNFNNKLYKYILPKCKWFKLNKLPYCRPHVYKQIKYYIRKLYNSNIKH